MAIGRETEKYGRHPQERCLGMCSGRHDSDREERGCSVGCTIGVSYISASHVLQPGNVPSGVSRTKKMHFQAGVFTRCSDISYFFLTKTILRSIIRTYLVNHAACKVEFQPFARSY